MTEKSRYPAPICRDCSKYDKKKGRCRSDHSVSITDGYPDGTCSRRVVDMMGEQRNRDQFS